jgi:hypothetical protein
MTVFLSLPAEAIGAGAHVLHIHIAFVVQVAQDGGKGLEGLGT